MIFCGEIAVLSETTTHHSNLFIRIPTSIETLQNDTMIHFLHFSHHKIILCFTNMFCSLYCRWKFPISHNFYLRWPVLKLNRSFCLTLVSIMTLSHSFTFIYSFMYCAYEKISRRMIKIHLHSSIILKLLLYPHLFGNNCDDKIVDFTKFLGSPG